MHLFGVMCTFLKLVSLGFVVLCTLKKRLEINFLCKFIFCQVIHIIIVDKRVDIVFFLR